MQNIKSWALSLYHADASPKDYFQIFWTFFLQIWEQLLERSVIAILHLSAVKLCEVTFKSGTERTGRPGIINRVTCRKMIGAILSSYYWIEVVELRE